MFGLSWFRQEVICTQITQVQRIFGLFFDVKSSQTAHEYSIRYTVQRLFDPPVGGEFCELS